MDWVKQLNEAIHYIEENLTTEISYETISKIAGCSVYNFQRMFSYIADKPLSEYIRNRRLTMAAFDLLNSTDRIIDIALKYGYESPDSFSRAFKSFHGVLPSSVRNETVQLKSCPKLSFQMTIKGAYHMNYQIEQWPAFKVMGISHKVLFRLFIQKACLYSWGKGDVPQVLHHKLKGLRKKPSAGLL